MKVAMSRCTTARFRIKTVLLVASTVLVGAMYFSANSADALEIYKFRAAPSLTQAGGHPDLTIEYAGESSSEPPTTELCQCNDPKSIKISLPTGFIGNPHSTPQCNAADFARNTCAVDSQVGTVDLTIAIGRETYVFQGENVINAVPRPNQAGLLAVKFLPGIVDLPLYVVLASRTGGDYGLDTRVEGIERQLPVKAFKYQLWGVPADDSHTPDREYGVPSNSPLTPFLQNPGTCNTSLTSTVTITGYDGSVNSASAPWPSSTGCDQLSFNPSLSARPTTTEADSASGVDIDLTVPQLLSPTFPSPSEIKAATLSLPVGFSLNPNAADGKTSCADVAASIGTGREEAANCPEFAKIGTDTIDSSALPAPIPGGIYLGDPQPGNRYRVFLTANGYATHINLAGTIRPDPVTGQLVASFDNLPQSPLTEFNMHFFGAERGILATPTQCGKYAVESTFVPWDEELPTQSSTQFFVIDAGPGGAPCPEPVRPFNPSFSASSAKNIAGDHSPFSIELGRKDGDQNLSGLRVSTPPGFSAALAGIPYCPEAALAAAGNSGYYSGLLELSSPSCPAASQIGISMAGAGAGSRPLYLPGKVYLAGPYKGAPLSLAVITPAVSGPYDLGNVVIRAALNVDRTDAHVTAISDPFPQIFEGIQLRLRSIRVSLDRDNFALNPTNCDPFQVSAALLGDQGTESDRSSHYQVANCAILDFAPKLSLKFTGGVRRKGHPAIHAELTAKRGEANIRRVAVTLPKGELLDNSHIGTVCTKVDFAKDSCPTRSLLGKAEVTTRLLDRPLKGSVYLRSSEHALPDLALDLEGQIDVEATARIDSVNQRLRAVFETVPDVPVSRIVLDLAGGSKGLVQNSETLCGGSKQATTRMAGQNGATLETKTKLQVSCGSRARHKGSKGAR